MFRTINLRSPTLETPMGEATASGISQSDASSDLHPQAWTRPKSRQSSLHGMDHVDGDVDISGHAPRPVAVSHGERDDARTMRTSWQGYDAPAHRWMIRSDVTGLQSCADRSSNKADWKVTVACERIHRPAQVRLESASMHNRRVRKGAMS